jgi:hypothetical protein
LSLYGYTTKRDLQPIGVVAIFALWGIVGMSLLSFLFPPSGFFETAITVGVLAISGVLVAFDTQNLKRSYFAFEGRRARPCRDDELGCAELLHPVLQHLRHDPVAPVPPIGHGSCTRHESPARKGGAFSLRQGQNPATSAKFIAIAEQDPHAHPRPDHRNRTADPAPAAGGGFRAHVCHDGG